ncbi:hypothetical protein CQY20_00425 [Mycolicibacterium agri]|uniref:Lipoprotein LpqE n=1 Tax=Mycolicibacterium agri TaxID=36811 RepID=A0A2A7NIC5_MYCAG|nr:hypothetical protein [Mycolicibacterium agri]PEG43218.1 hypothetical protein CQY20_00425 [Mycolicibacterium agri]
MKRFKPRRSLITAAVAACGVAAATALAGCGAGQISQTATQQAAVNGAAANVSDTVALRNVHMRADQDSDFLEPGTEVPLVFVATNDSPDVADKLVRVTSDVGTVRLTGDLTLQPMDVLEVSREESTISALEQAERATAAKATVDLSKPVTNGLTYNFTFTFEKAGEVTVAVPISASEGRERGSSGGSGGDTGGHH